MGLRIGRLDQGFDDFVIGRSAALMRTALLLSAGDRAAAEDLLQTALLRLARNWTGARDHPDAYVRTVLVNLSRDAARRRRRRPVETPVPSPPESPLTTSGDDESDAADRVALLEALGDLPPRQRVTVVLRYWEDMSVAETAHLLGCSQGTVKSNTARALERLRRVLAEPVPIRQEDHSC